MSNTFWGPDEQLDNGEEKTLCVLLLDTSGSMTGSKIDDLNEGLNRLYENIIENPCWEPRIEIAIIAFETEVHYLQRPALVENFTMPTLSAMGGTNMVAGIQKAIEVIEDRKQYYRNNGIPYKRPWIIMMTDGSANVDSVRERVKEDGNNKRYLFQPIAIGDDADMVVLDSLSTTQRVFRLNEENNIAFFLHCLSYELGNYSMASQTDKYIIDDWFPEFEI